MYYVLIANQQVNHLLHECVIITLSYRSNEPHPMLLRGAVFYIAMSLWGPFKVKSLKHSFGSVLPSLRQVCVCVCVCVCMCVYMCVYICVCVYVCMYVCVHVCVHASACTRVSVFLRRLAYLLLCKNG